MDRYPRSPDRGRYGREAPATDSYVPSGSRGPRQRSRSPGGPRRRSRTPPRPQADTWRAAPQRGYDSRDVYAPRDARPRSPRRDYRAPESRYDDRVGKRGRESSLNGRGARSPPPAKRERLASPARDYRAPRSVRTYSPPRERPAYRARSRSPGRRDERNEPYAGKEWRRRSPSPRAARPADGSGRNSGATSRRSSPRGYARRPYEADETRPAYQSPRPRSPGYGRNSIPPARERSPYPPEAAAAREPYPSREAAPSEYYDRPPPTGPAGFAASPPTGPSAVSMSAHNRPGSASIPSAPRGSYGGYRGRGGPPRGDFGRDFSGPPRGGSYRGGPTYPRGGREAYPPRESYPSRDMEYRGAPRGGSYRGSANSTSTTYPRTQVFNKPNSATAHLADLPSIKDGGEKLPPLHDLSRAEALEEQSARLRKEIDQRQAKKRAGLREWEKADRESQTAALRSELADEALKGLNGESETASTAF